MNINLATVPRSPATGRDGRVLRPLGSRTAITDRPCRLSACRDIGKRLLFITFCGGLCAATVAGARDVPVIVERFDGPPAARWQVQRNPESKDGEFDWRPGQPGLWFVTPTAPVSPGHAVCEWPIGTQPFEVTWRVELLGGDGMANRVPSLHVAVTTAAPGAMRAGDDYAIVMGVGNPGVSAGVRRGPLYQLNQNREGHPPFRSRLLDGWLPGLGDGSRNANIGWFNDQLRGQTVSLQMRRTAEGRLEFAAWHHAIGREQPWWRDSAPVPAGLADKPLTHLAILVSPAPAGHPFHGPQSRVRGWLHDLQARPLSAPRPVILAVEPVGHVARAGGELRIRGEQFGDRPQVRLGDQPATVLQAGNHELRVRLPATLTAGRYRLEVQHPTGTVGLWQRELPVGRVLERVEPREVLPAGGEEVTVWGAGFGPDTVISFNDQPATVVERVDWTRVRVRVPAGVAGPARVTARSGGEEFAGAPRFGYAPHPYLAYRAEELPALRRKFAEPVLAPYRQAILKDAEKAVDLTKLTGPDANNFPYGPWLAYLMTGERRYRDRLLELLAVLCAQRNHHQFQIQKAVVVAQVYDSLFAELSAAERQMMIEYLDRSLDEYLERTRRNDWWFANNPSNTIAVGANGGGHAALALLYSRAEEAREAIETAVRLVRSRYQGITDEGASVEGTLYWDYGLSQQVILGHALRRALGDDRGLLNSPRLENAIQFARSQMGGAGFMFVNNNTQPWLTGVAIAADTGSRYDQPFMRWLADRIVTLYLQELPHPEGKRSSVFTRSKFIALAFLYRDTVPAPAEPPSLPTLAKLDSVQWATARSAPGFIGPLVLNVKGHAGLLGHHKHPDKGNFQLHGRGEAWIITPGYYNSRPTDLSVPLVDGQAGDAGEQTAAPITACWERGPYRAISVDATAAYAKTARAQRVARHFVMLGDQAVVILDDIQPARGAPGLITAQFQAHYPATLLGDRPVIQGERARLVIETHGPAIEWSIEGPRDFGRSWVYRRWQQEGWVAWHSIRGRYRALPEAPLVSVLQVTDAAGELPAPAIVRRERDRVTVALAGGLTARFERKDERWTIIQPN